MLKTSSYLTGPPQPLDECVVYASDLAVHVDLNAVDKCNAEHAEWWSRVLDDLEVVYMWVDGVYLKAGLDREKAAIPMAVAAPSGGSKVSLGGATGVGMAVYGLAGPGYR